MLLSRRGLALVSLMVVLVIIGIVEIHGVFHIVASGTMSPSGISGPGSPIVD